MCRASVPIFVLAGKSQRCRPLLTPFHQGCSAADGLALAGDNLMDDDLPAAFEDSLRRWSDVAEVIQPCIADLDRNGEQLFLTLRGLLQNSAGRHHPAPIDAQEYGAASSPSSRSGPKPRYPAGC